VLRWAGHAVDAVAWLAVMSWLCNVIKPGAERQLCFCPPECGAYVTEIMEHALCVYNGRHDVQVFELWTVRAAALVCLGQ